MGIHVTFLILIQENCKTWTHLTSMVLFKPTNQKSAYIGLKVTCEQVIHIFKQDGYYSVLDFYQGRCILMSQYPTLLFTGMRI